MLCDKAIDARNGVRKLAIHEALKVRVCKRCWVATLHWEAWKDAANMELPNRG